MRNILTVLAALALCLQTAAPAQTPEPDGALVVIVHPDNPVAELSLKELRQIFRAEKRTWNDGERIHLVAVRGAAEDRFNRRVLDLSTKQVRKFWLQKIFQGETRPLKSLPEAADLLAFVARTPQAIGFIGHEAVDGSVKVVHLEGKAPDASGYPLK